MGNRICLHPLVILTDEIAMHFKAANLEHDVTPIVDRWRKQGADLWFGLREFQNMFNIITAPEQQFAVFDIDKIGRVDAYEVFMVYILLATGDIEKKIEAVFSVIHFPSEQAAYGTINFDETYFLIAACVKGLQKVCKTDFAIEDDSIAHHCKSVFDLHRMPHTGRISSQQFRSWVLSEKVSFAFVNLFHNAMGLRDLLSLVQTKNMEQASVFQMAACGFESVTPRELLASSAFKSVLEDPTDAEIADVMDLMLQRSESIGQIESEAYHETLRPWNIFNVCDISKQRKMHDKELEVLLWAHLRVRPSSDIMVSFRRTYDLNHDSDITRIEFVRAIVDSELEMAKLSGRGES